MAGLVGLFCYVSRYLRDTIVHSGICQINSKADLNGDCKVDFFDLTKFAGYWLSDCFPEAWCEQADIDQSGVVAWSDFAVLAERWLDCYLEPQGLCLGP